MKKIGVFDSGIGGLSVLKELVRLPVPHFIYFADTAHLPYGSKSPDQIRQLTTNAVRELMRQEVDLVVIACHTASSNALSHVQNVFPHMPIIGVVNPAVRHAVQATKNKRIGIMGTQATIDSHIHKKLLQAHDADMVVIEQACPRLVPLIEAGIPSPQELTYVLQDYVRVFVEHDVDTVIIGCTHYELIKPAIEHVLPMVALASAPQTTAEIVRTMIEPGSITPLIEYIVTGDKEQFEYNAQTIARFAIRLTASSKTPFINL